MQETKGHIEFGLQIIPSAALLTQRVSLQNANTYKFSHSLQQHVWNEIILVY